MAPSGQPVAALAVAAPTARMELHRTDGIGRMVAVAAEELSAAIGGPE